MPEYNVVVHFIGNGRIRVRAESESQAKEDAAQMAVEDIEFDSYEIQPETVNVITAKEE